MELLKIARHLQDEATYPAVLATLVRVEGSSYRRVGARLLVAADGRHWGSISGGCLETDLITRALTLIRSNTTHECVSYDTTGEQDLVWGVGTGCHGTVHLLLETIFSRPDWLQPVREAERARRVITLSTSWRAAPDGSPARFGTRVIANDSAQTATSSDSLTQQLLPCWHLVLFGAGDDARPLVEMAKLMEWKVSVIDPRRSHATCARFPSADEVRCLAPEESVTALTWDERTVAVILTHHYIHDLPLLQMLLPMHLPFLGLLGPKERGQRLLKDAKADPADAALLHSPVGLDLGGDGPTAVALSIVSEIQSCLHQRDAQPLRNRARPIHAND